MDFPEHAQLVYVFIEERQPGIPKFEILRSKATIPGRCLYKP
mgnify:CR=1 FL=1